MYAYWLLTTDKAKKQAAKVIKSKEGFIGFYPNSFDKDYFLVAIFDTRVHAGAAAFDVETTVKVGGVPNFTSRVEDCNGL
jgi:hypothetical protein